MPQKKNPDALELIRGKCARVIGNLSTILILLKGLPMTYNKDMQEDKEALFDTVDTLNDALRVMAIVLRNIEISPERVQEALNSGYLLATDLADYLVKKGLEFRKAHEVVGRIVLYAAEHNKRVEELSLQELRSMSDRIEADVFRALTIESALQTRGLVGGTSRSRVRAQLKQAEREIGQLKKQSGVRRSESGVASRRKG